MKVFLRILTWWSYSFWIHVNRFSVGIQYYLASVLLAVRDCLCKHPLLRAMLWVSLFATRVYWAELSEQHGLTLTGLALQCWGLNSIAFSLCVPIGRYCFILKGQTQCNYAQKVIPYQSMLKTWWQYSWNNF